MMRPRYHKNCHQNYSRYVRPISASIIVLAAVILIVGSALLEDRRIQFFALLAGGGVGIFGLVGWFISFRDEEK
jgi:hypothetical protein